jgi:hypothetical protein
MQDQLVSVVEDLVWKTDPTADSVVAPLVEAIQKSPSMEFLPLMLISVYCALGVTWVWLRLGYRFLAYPDELSNQTEIKITSSTPKKNSLK